jgi:hypothetical protein
MPWNATLDSAEEPTMTTRLAIENHRNHPRIATAASRIATLMPMPHTALAAPCIQSEEVGSSHRDVIGKKAEGVRCDQDHARPAQAPVLRISPARQTPIPKAIRNRSWIVMTVSIPGRTGEPVAVSSLIH